VSKDVCKATEIIGTELQYVKLQYVRRATSHHLLRLNSQTVSSSSAGAQVWASSQAHRQTDGQTQKRRSNSYRVSAYVAI